MKQLRVEQAADKLVASDAARAAATSRENKPDPHTTRRDPGPGKPEITPPQIDIVSTLDDGKPAEEAAFAAAMAAAREEGVREEERMRAEGWNPQLGYPNPDDVVLPPDVDPYSRPMEPARPESPSRPAWFMPLVGLVVVALIAVAVLVSGVLNGGAPGPTGPAGSQVANASGTPGVATQAPSASAAGPIATAECRTADVFQRFVQAATLAVLHELCSRQMPDLKGDGVEYNGEPATVKPTVGDLATIADPAVTLSDADAAALNAACRRQPPYDPAVTPAPLLPAGPVESGVYCGDTDPSAGDYELYAMEMTTPIALDPTALWEAGVGFSKAGDKRWASAIADPLNGHSWFLTVRFSAQGGVYGPLAGSWSGKQATFFDGQKTGALALIDGEVMLVLVPKPEWAGNEACRWFTYYGKSDGSGGSVDLWPDPGKPETSCIAT